MQKLQITDIQKTKKGRFSIFISNEYALSVDEEVLIKNKLTIGKLIDVEELKNISFQSQFNKALNKAYFILSFRPHSCSELKFKLSKFYEDDIISLIIEKLLDLGLLNDEDFAKLYLKQNINKKKFSVNKLRYELKSKGISSDLIEDCLIALEDFDESDIVKDIILKKHRKHLVDNNIQKIKMSLFRKGFGFNDINIGLDKAVKELYENEVI